MKFYSLQNSIDRKVLGNYPQTKDVQYSCNVWDNLKFIEHIHFEKIDFKPIIANAILNPKSKQTDLIDANSAIGFSNKLLVSGKLKKLLEKNRKNGIQFFNSPIKQNNQTNEDYWILNFYEFNYNYIDFLNSKIVYNKKAEDYKVSFKTIKEQINIENYEQFEKKRSELWEEKNEILIIEKLKLNNSIINEDFFVLRYVFGALYFVSEKLKKEIEDAGCTGIEFQPVELSINEWLQGGEREKVYGKV